MAKFQMFAGATECLTVFVEPHIKEALKQIAREKKFSISQVVRYILETGLKQMGKLTNG